MATPIRREETSRYQKREKTLKRQTQQKRDSTSLGIFT